MSNALLEACAHGRLAVTSRIPGNVAVLGDDHRYLFSAGDHVDLARQLLAAINDSRREREEVRRRTITRVEQRFSTRTVLDQLEGLIRDSDTPRN